MSLIRTVFIKARNSAPKGALFCVVLLLAISCSPTTRNLFFDIPPPKPQAEQQQQEQIAAAEASAGQTDSRSASVLLHPHDRESNRPPIEEVLVWEEALEMLPKDEKGNPDWEQARRDGTIKPRALDPRDRNSEWFRLDFYLEGKNPKFDAWFPHSSHVAIMGCESCHAAVFRYRDNEITMKAMRNGEYCGACHGNVAFSTRNCARCHTNM